MSTETPERIAEIRARREALTEHATIGDWHYGGDDAVQVFPATGTSELVATIWGEADEERVLGEFIAHSKDDVDWLLAEVERLRAELATVQGEAETAGGAQ